MAIEQITYPYEVLIRLGPSGYQGSHRIDVQRVWDPASGHILAEQALPARGITLADCEELLGAQAGLIEQNDALQAQVATLNGLLDDRDETITSLEAVVAQLEARIAELEALAAAPAQDPDQPELPFDE